MGKIVWLASYPKSGNTWVRAFLHNYITASETAHGINRLTDFSVSESHAMFYKKHDSRAACAYTPAEVQKMRPLVHTEFTALHDDLVFVKTHNAALSVHGTALCTPAVTAGAVYIVRDPRDVAVSYSHYTGLSIDAVIAFMGKTGAANRGTDAQVFEFLSTWSHHAASWLAAPRTLVLRYEDLLAAPAENFGRMIRFLGDAEAEPVRLARAIAFSDFPTLAAQEQAEGYAAGGPNAAAPFFRKGQAGGWRDVLTAAQALRIEFDHAAMMRRFRYL